MKKIYCNKNTPRPYIVLFSEKNKTSESYIGYVNLDKPITLKRIFFGILSNDFRIPMLGINKKIQDFAMDGEKYHE